MRRFFKGAPLAVVLAAVLVTSVAAAGVAAWSLFGTDFGPVMIVGPSGGVLKIKDPVVGPIEREVKAGGLVSTVALAIVNTSKVAHAQFSISLNAKKGGGEAFPANKAGFGMAVMVAEAPIAGSVPTPPTWTDRAGPIGLLPGQTMYVLVDVRALPKAQAISLTGLEIEFAEEEPLGKGD